MKVVRRQYQEDVDKLKELSLEIRKFRSWNAQGFPTVVDVSVSTPRVDVIKKMSENIQFNFRQKKEVVRQIKKVTEKYPDVFQDSFTGIFLENWDWVNLVVNVMSDFISYIDKNCKPEKEEEEGEEEEKEEQSSIDAIQEAGSDEPDPSPIQEHHYYKLVNMTTFPRYKDAVVQVNHTASARGYYVVTILSNFLFCPTDEDDKSIQDKQITVPWDCLQALTSEAVHAIDKLNELRKQETDEYIPSNEETRREFFDLLNLNYSDNSSNQKFTGNKKKVRTKVIQYLSRFHPDKFGRAQDEYLEKYGEEVYFRNCQRHIQQNEEWFAMQIWKMEYSIKKKQFNTVLKRWIGWRDNDDGVFVPSKKFEFNPYVVQLPL